MSQSNVLYKSDGTWYILPLDEDKLESSYLKRLVEGEYIIRHSRNGKLAFIINANSLRDKLPPNLLASRLYKKHVGSDTPVYGILPNSDVYGNAVVCESQRMIEDEKD